MFMLKIFLKRQAIMANESMTTISRLLYLHHALWDMEDTVEYFGKMYAVYKPEHKGFSRVIVPGKSGKKILYITQNLNQSTYGTLEIQAAAKAGKTTRITWIVDPSDGGFEYIGLIKTTDDSKVIEKYTSFGTEVLYHSNPLLTTRKSIY
jgi:hypothetical protein